MSVGVFARHVRAVRAVPRAVHAVEHVGPPVTGDVPGESGRPSVSAAASTSMDDLVDRRQDRRGADLLDEAVVTAIRSESRRPWRWQGRARSPRRATDDPAGPDRQGRRRRQPPESTSKRRHEERDRREEEQIRGPGRHEQPPERVRLDVGARREALYDEERTQPARRGARGVHRRTRSTATTPAIGAHCTTRALKKNSRR